MSTQNLNTAFAARYPSGEYAVLYEVSDATGGRSTRRADAVVMSCWPSRGLWLAGFEFKASRSDWVREKTNPEKSEAVQQFCDYWWVVADDDKIVRDGELPKAWGLLVLRDGKLETVTDAPKLEAKPCTRAFVASMLRTAQKGYVPKSAVHEMVEEQAAERARNLAGPDARVVDEFHKIKKAHDDLQARVSAFEIASGLNIQQWSADSVDEVGRIGRAVSLLLGGQYQRHAFASARDWLKRASKMVDEAEREIDAALPAERAAGGAR